MTNRTLSPAAQAVLNASSDAPVGGGWNADRLAIAAALRAAIAHTQQRQYNDCWICDANELLAIATELEGA
jgi:hypothetical protein